jgi:hypothetical protein
MRPLRHNLSLTILRYIYLGSKKSQYGTFFYFLSDFDKICFKMENATKVIPSILEILHNFYRTKMEGGRRPKSANLQVNIFILHRITMYKGFLLIQFVFFYLFQFLR